MTQNSMYFSIFVTFFLCFVYTFYNILFPFVCAFLLAYIFVPAVDFLHKYKIAPKHSSALFTIIFVTIFIYICLEIIPIIQTDFLNLIKNLPDYCERVIAFLKHKQAMCEDEFYKKLIGDVINSIPSFFGQNISSFTSSIVKQIIYGGTTITSIISGLIITPISFFYFLKDWNKLTNAISSWIPKRYKKTEKEVYIVIRTSVTNYLHGQFLVGTMLFIYYYVLLSLLKIDLAFLFAVMSGIFSFVPYLGSLFCLFVVLIYAIVGFYPDSTLWLILLFYLIGQMLEGYVLSPKFVGKKAGLHPLWIFFAFFAGYELGGVFGVCVALPATSIFGNLIKYIYAKFHRSEFYKK